MTRLTFLQLEPTYQMIDKSPVHAFILGAARSHGSALGKDSNEPFAIHPAA